MVASGKLHPNLLDYILFLIRKRSKANKKQILSSEKLRNSGNSTASVIRHVATSLQHGIPGGDLHAPHYGERQGVGDFSITAVGNK